MHTRTRTPRITFQARPKAMALAKTLKVTAALGLAMSLSGCIVALPPAVQFASLALDGVSYVTTGKSVTDHAISGVTNKDCAMLRGLKGEDICAENQIQVATLPDGTPAPSASEADDAVETADEDETFRAFAANDTGATAGMDLDEILSDRDIAEMELDLQTASGPDEPVF